MLQPRILVRLALFVFVVFLVTATNTDSLKAEPTSNVTDICPANALVNRGPEFQPAGIILTTFDSTALWLYNVSNSQRYPLPDTVPCGNNCHPSPDGNWITYFNDNTNSYNRMRLNGTQRELVVVGAGDVEWWSQDTLLVWTPGHNAYLRPLGDDSQREYLPVNGVLSVQPGGRWGLAVEPSGDGFARVLVNLELRGLMNVREQRAELGNDTDYFGSSAWAPSGEWLALVATGPFDSRVSIAGGELFGIRPGDAQMTQWTNFSATTGAVRINGRSSGDLSWSPDSSKIAFWVTPLTGPNPTADLGNATLHVYDVTTGELRSYCGFTTNEHTPNTPRLVWSPDGTHVAFGGNLPDDNRGYLLLALNVETGVFTTLSEGLYPALGAADVIAWGYAP
jgi:hypothetical protein